MKRDRASAAVGCGCGASDLLLHNIRHRGAFHRLCTSCVLRFHLGSFCPVCLQLFDRSSPSDSIKCSKCPSLSHSACVGQVAAASYVCACCLNPNYLAFDSRPEEGLMRGALDLKSAQALVAAAELASLSMSRAAAAARVGAERKVRESAIATKRAKEALERVALVALSRKESKEVPLAKDKKTLKGVRAGSSVMAQKRIHVRKLGGGPKISALSNLGIQETGKLVGLQGKDALGGAREKTQIISGPSLLGSLQRQCFSGRHSIAVDGRKSKGVADSGLGTAQLLSSKKGE